MSKQQAASVPHTSLQQVFSGVQQPAPQQVFPGSQQWYAKAGSAQQTSSPTAQQKSDEPAGQHFLPEQRGGCSHAPVDRLHESAVQTSPSSQFLG